MRITDISARGKEFITSLRGNFHLTKLRKPESRKDFIAGAQSELKKNPILARNLFSLFMPPEVVLESLNEINETHEQNTLDLNQLTQRQRNLEESDHQTKIFNYSMERKSAQNRRNRGHSDYKTYGPTTYYDDTFFDKWTPIELHSREAHSKVAEDIKKASAKIKATESTRKLLKSIADLVT